MATIKGIWKVNEVVEIVGIVQDVNFSCGDYTEQTKISVITSNNRIMIQPAFSNVYTAAKGWVTAKYRVWDFGETEQEVSDEFATWLYQNASGGKVTFPATDGNITVMVKENGTTTLATEGTYCETDIDVKVEVPTYVTVATEEEAIDTVAIPISDGQVIVVTGE